MELIFKRSHYCSKQGLHTVSELKKNPSIMGHRGSVSNSHTMFNRKDCLVLLSALKAVNSITESNTAATLIQLLNSRQLITIAMFLADNIKLATCVNPNVIFLLQSANTKPSSTLLLLARLMSANCTL